MKYLKSYNESVTNYLRPKSNEEVLKSLEGLSNYEKFIKALKYDMVWLIKKLLDSGCDISQFISWFDIVGCFNQDKKELVKVLLSNPKIKNKFSNKNYIHQLETYQKALGLISQNESITQYLKPKSTEEILKSINKSDNFNVEKLRDALEKDCSRLFNKWDNFHLDNLDNYFKNGEDFYSFLINDLKMNKIKLKYRLYSQYDRISGRFSINDILNALSKNDLLKIANKLWIKK